MDVGLVAGPWGVTFEEVSASVRAAERHGFASYYLGDHFYTVAQIDSLEPYLLFALAARETERIRFGPLVTPVMFRPPASVGRLAAQLDILSGGRFVLGLGAGWNEREHTTYGLDYPPLGERFDQLEEMIEVLRRMWGAGPASWEGRYYQLREAQTLPKPAAGRPPILIGGTGEKRTLRIVANYAHEWNCVDLTPAAYRRKSEVLAAHCDAVGRDPHEIRRSMTTMGLIGETEAEVEAAAQSCRCSACPHRPASPRRSIARRSARTARSWARRTRSWRSWGGSPKRGSTRCSSSTLTWPRSACPPSSRATCCHRSRRCSAPASGSGR